MSLQRTALLFLTLAYAILLGHNIIPHHHHENERELTEHHQTHHDHEGEKNTGDIGHQWSHFIHSFDGFTLAGNHSISNTLSKQLHSIIALFTGNFSLDKELIPPLLYKPPAERCTPPPPDLLPSGLRAPPAFTA